MRGEGGVGLARGLDDHLPACGVPGIRATGVREVPMLGHCPGVLRASESTHTRGRGVVLLSVAPASDVRTSGFNRPNKVVGAVGSPFSRVVVGMR